MIYKKLFIIYILLFIKICCAINYRNVTLYLMMYAFDDGDNSYQRQLINGFNEYCKQKGLNIYMEANVLTPNVSTTVIENYGATIDALLKKGSHKYDIYFYYSAYSKKHSEHFLNLREYLPEEYIKVFDENLLLQTCSSQDKKKLVGLPIYLYVSTLYSNQDLLSKYNMEAPKTWDELLNTSKYIYDEEKKLNNTVTRYIGSFNDYAGSMSLFEFINSFRESNSSPHPEITSETTIKALKKLKEMKYDLGEDVFSSSEESSTENLFFSGKALFLRYFYNPHVPVYKGSALPGHKKGVSGTVVIPNNFAINNYIEEYRKKAAIEFMKYISLKETQKKYIINNFMLSAMTELYDDEEVCSVIDCAVMKDSYPFSFMSNEVNLFGDDNYHIKYRKILFKYLFDDEPLMEVLKKIEDITKIQTFSLKTDESYIGLIMFIITLVFSISMILLLIFLFIKKLEYRFKFLCKSFWIITALGSLMIMSSIMSLYGEVTNAKCHLRIFLINMGFVLSICPCLHKMITNFPEKNKISMWFEKNKYIFIFIIVIFTGFLNGIFAIPSYNLQLIRTSDEKNYKKCIMNNTLIKLMYYSIQLYQIIIILISLLLMFIEWNLEETYMDINFQAAAIFMDILLIILLNIINKVKFKNYIVYYALLTINIMFFSVSNYVFIYFTRLLPVFGNNKFKNSKQILKEILNSELNDSRRRSYTTSSFNNDTNKNTEYDPSVSVASTNNSKLKRISKKIVDYHNQTNITNTDQI